MTDFVKKLEYGTEVINKLHSDTTDKGDKYYLYWQGMLDGLNACGVIDIKTFFALLDKIPEELVCKYTDIYFKDVE